MLDGEGPARRLSRGIAVHFSQMNAATGGFDVDLAFAPRDVDAATRGASEDRPFNLPEMQAAARGLAARLPGQIGHLDAPARGLEIDVELLWNRNDETHLKISAFVSPAPGPTLVHFRVDLDRIAVLAEFHLVVFQHLFPPGAAFAADLPQHFDGDLVAAGCFDFDGAAIGVDGEFATGLDLIRLRQLVFHIARHKRARHQKQAALREPGGQGTVCIHNRHVKSAFRCKSELQRFTVPGSTKTRTPEAPAELQLFPLNIEQEMVGAVRFELTTSCTRNKRASQATLRPDAAKTLPVASVDCNEDFAARRFGTLHFALERARV